MCLRVLNYCLKLYRKSMVDGVADNNIERRDYNLVCLRIKGVESNHTLAF